MAKIKIKQLADKGENFFPITNTKAVYDDAGNRLDNTINTLNENLTAEDNLQFKFGKDGDGNYGYYGADGSLIPFKSGFEKITMTTKIEVPIKSSWSSIFSTGTKSFTKVNITTTSFGGSWSVRLIDNNSITIASGNNLSGTYDISNSDTLTLQCYYPNNESSYIRPLTVEMENDMITISVN